ncbi:hypothetical protein FJZ31_05675 [Candidatus Poribacteria bacterium]|nr:hypothetical protein [Candidatus Poribacteria bacterium]
MKNQLTFCVAVITFIVILLTGCEKQITRKADWETNFNDIHFVDAKHGWVIGEKRMIIHTDDGGNTWKRQDFETSLRSLPLSEAKVKPCSSSEFIRLPLNKGG